jgi:hypothetical protein
MVENAIFIFTTNTADRKTKDTGYGLEERFVSRCVQLQFSMWGASKEIADFLAGVWHDEGGGDGVINWERVVSDKGSNIRDCLQQVEAELLARGVRNAGLPDNADACCAANSSENSPKLNASS